MGIKTKNTVICPKTIWKRFENIHFICDSQIRQVLVFAERRFNMPIPVAAWTKAWVYGLSLTGIAGLNPAGRDGYLSLVRAVCVN
jgi:hypothetical protein